LYLDSLLHIQELPQNCCSHLLNRATKEVGFIVQLTGIESTMPASGIMGYLGISKEDYLNWSLWNFRNKKNLFLEDGEIRFKIK
jgi:hypothetical protein